MTNFIKEILSSKLLDKLRAILDEVITSKEEKEALHNRLQELVHEHEQALVKAEVDDRRSAREREVAGLNSGSLNLTQNVLAYTAIAAFFAITGYIISRGLGHMDAEESFIIGNLTGMAGAIAKDIYGYYFGSSKGEKTHVEMPRRK